MDITSNWIKANHMQINAKNMHEMLVSFSKKPPQQMPIVIEGVQIECVNSKNLVGVHIQEDLNWDTHVDYMIK